MPGLDQTLVNWQCAPAEHELANYDEPKFRYRALVENYIKPLSNKSLRKKTFYTIVTNVLCADIRTSNKDSIDPIEKDIYLPLEIAITKWSLMEGKIPVEERKLNHRFWMINPGPPVRLCNSIAMDHAKKHKIIFDHGENKGQNPYIEEDLNKVMKEINSFLSADRTVFSMQLSHVRQDLGCLKWLNRETGFKSKPISVYSLEDLYVALMRKLTYGMDVITSQGIARFRLYSECDAYNLKLQCSYHRTKALSEEDGDTWNCALSLSQGYSNAIVDDIYIYIELQK